MPAVPLLRRRGRGRGAEEPNDELRRLAAEGRAPLDAEAPELDEGKARAGHVLLPAARPKRMCFARKVTEAATDTESYASITARKLRPRARREAFSSAVKSPTK